MYFVPGLTWNGTLGLRIDASITAYGHESVDVWLGPRMPSDYLRINTDNLIASFGAGPQFTLGTGSVRPYGFGTIGGSYFTTVTRTDGGEYDYASNTNFDDWSLALTAGGGLLVQLSRKNTPLWLDLSGQWTRNGVTDYLRKGSIVETPSGGLLVLPIRSEANFLSFRVGITFGF